MIYRILFFFFEKEEIQLLWVEDDGVRRGGVAVEDAVSNRIIKEGQDCPYGTDRSGLG